MPQYGRHCISLITASQVVLGNPGTMPITTTKCRTPEDFGCIVGNPYLAGLGTELPVIGPVTPSDQ